MARFTEGEHPIYLVVHYIEGFAVAPDCIGTVSFSAFVFFEHHVADAFELAAGENGSGGVER